MCPCLYIALIPCSLEAMGRERERERERMLSRDSKREPLEILFPQLSPPFLIQIISPYQPIHTQRRVNTDYPTCIIFYIYRYSHPRLYRHGGLPSFSLISLLNSLSSRTRSLLVFKSSGQDVFEPSIFELFWPRFSIWVRQIFPLLHSLT